MKTIDDYLTKDTEEAPEDTVQAGLLKQMAALEDKVAYLEKLVNASDFIMQSAGDLLVNDATLQHVKLGPKAGLEFNSNSYKVEAFDGVEYCWLGPNKITTFELPVDRSQTRTVTLNFYSECMPGLFGALRYYVDGELVQYELVPDALREAGAAHAVSFEVLPANTKRETKISLFAPHVVSPMELGTNPNDKRLLSVALMSMVMQ